MCTDETQDLNPRFFSARTLIHDIANGIRCWNIYGACLLLCGRNWFSVRLFWTVIMIYYFVLELCSLPPIAEMYPMMQTRVLASGITTTLTTNPVQYFYLFFFCLYFTYLLLHLNGWTGYCSFFFLMIFLVYSVTMAGRIN